MKMTVLTILMVVLLCGLAGCGDIDADILKWNTANPNEVAAKGYDTDGDGIIDVVASDANDDGEVTDDEIVQAITAKIEIANAADDAVIATVETARDVAPLFGPAGIAAVPILTFIGLLLRKRYIQRLPVSDNKTADAIRAGTGVIRSVTKEIARMSAEEGDALKVRLYDDQSEATRAAVHVVLDTAKDATLEQ